MKRRKLEKDMVKNILKGIGETILCFFGIFFMTGVCLAEDNFLAPLNVCLKVASGYLAAAMIGFLGAALLFGYWLIKAINRKRDCQRYLKDKEKQIKQLKVLIAEMQRKESQDNKEEAMNKQREKILQTIINDPELNDPGKYDEEETLGYADDQKAPISDEELDDVIGLLDQN